MAAGAGLLRGDQAQAPGGLPGPCGQGVLVVAGRPADGALARWVAGWLARYWTAHGLRVAWRDARAQRAVPPGRLAARPLDWMAGACRQFHFAVAWTVQGRRAGRTSWPAGPGPSGVATRTVYVRMHEGENPWAWAAGACSECLLVVQALRAGPFTGCEPAWLARCGRPVFEGALSDALGRLACQLLVPAGAGAGAAAAVRGPASPCPS
ncbi:MAG TPA: hypothetical protein VIL11_05610 [Limnochordales bacterium]